MTLMITNTSKSRKSEAKLFSDLHFMQGYGGDACKMLKMAVEAVPAQTRQNGAAGHHLLLHWLSLRADCGLHPFFRIMSPACPCPPELDLQHAASITGGPLNCEHHGIWVPVMAAAYLGPEEEVEVILLLWQKQCSPS